MKVEAALGMLYTRYCHGAMICQVVLEVHYSTKSHILGIRVLVHVFMRTDTEV